MSLRAADLLGLPAGFPSGALDAALLRDALVALAVAVGWTLARARPRLALALAVLAALVSAGFWMLAMARPYGLLLDPALTAWAADAATAAAGGGGLLAPDPPASAGWAGGARAVGAPAIFFLPGLAALLIVPAIAIVIALSWGKPHAPLAAILWLTASTMELDAGRGTALQLALLARPAAGLALAVAIAVALVAGRFAAGRVAVMAIAAVALAAAVVVRAAPLPLTDLPGALVFDGLAWIALGVAGTRVRPDAAAGGLAAGGALALVLAVAGLADPVAGAALLRAGLVLAAVPAVTAIADAVGGRLAIPLPRARVWTPSPASVLGAGVAIAMAGSFLTWWDPTRLDPIVRDSVEPVGAWAEEPAAWIAAHTEPGDAFVAGEDIAPAVAALAGRPVLRAPSLRTAADDDRRLRVERAILSGRVNAVQVRRYGLRYLLVTGRQFRHQGMPEPYPAETMFPLRYDGRGVRIYEIVRTGPDVEVDVDGMSPDEKAGGSPTQ